jgi:hypothetical protein
VSQSRGAEQRETIMADDNINHSESKGSRFREAFDRAMPEMKQLPESALVAINIDIPTVVTTVLGICPVLSTWHVKVAALPGFAIAQFDKLETYALATFHAHAVWLGASAPASTLVALGDSGAELRGLLLGAATLLAKRGMIDGQRLKELKGPFGYRNIALDLLALVAIFREVWTAIDGRAGASMSELEKAEAIAEELLRTVAEREQGPQLAADNRKRAFTLLVNAYDQARRALQYLRWDHDDADDIVPSLYAGRGARKRSVVTETEVVTLAQVTTPAPLPAMIAVEPAQPAVNGTSIDLAGSSPYTHSSTTFARSSRRRSPLARARAPGPGASRSGRGQ